MGFGVGVVVAAGVWLWPHLFPRYRVTAVPHLIAPIAEATPLRLAMLHDVFVEGGERRSPAWDEARIVKRQLFLTTTARLFDSKYWSAFDDIAASLDRLHRYDEGVTLLHDKIAQLAPTLPSNEQIATVLSELFGADDTVRLVLMESTLSEDDLPAYRAYANLATLMVHGAMSSPDPDKESTLAVARQWLVRAVTLHPGSHFGREIWQIVLVETLQAWQRDPSLAVQYDLLGRSLDGDRLMPEGSLLSPVGRKRLSGHLVLSEALIAKQESMEFFTRLRLRTTITTITPDPAWVAASASSLVHPFAFDEAAMALIGMWWYGGGPNPLTALTLAGICEEIGQHQLAWEGYARARYEIAQRPVSPTLTALDQYCQARQKLLTRMFDPEQLSTIQSGFNAQLQANFAEQARWERFEAESLAAGADVDDPTWLANWRASQPARTTQPGNEDWIKVHQTFPNDEPFQGLSALLFGSLAAWLVALIARESFLRRLRTFDPKSN